MRACICAAFVALLLAVFVVPAQADTIYNYFGDPFTFVQGVYAPGDRITGTLVLSDLFTSPLNEFGRYNVSAFVLSYSFTDGHQTLTQNNSTAHFELPFSNGTPLLPGGTNGPAGSWVVDIRGSNGGIRSIYVDDYDVTAWMGAPDPSGFHSCVPGDISQPLCFDNPKISEAEIFGLDNRAPGTRGVWRMKTGVVSTPEGGTATQFVIAGLLALIIVVRFKV